jgi:hypothetical protein
MLREQQQLTEMARCVFRSLSGGDCGGDVLREDAVGIDAQRLTAIPY